MIDPRSLRRGCVAYFNILILAALALAFATPSWAGDAEASKPEAEAAEASGPEFVPCAELARLKYPFLRCVRGPSGRPVFAAEGPGMAGARLKLGGDFASGAGGWGDSGIE